jgi:hypothetical protein
MRKIVNSKLAVLGVATLVLGVVQDIAGLMAVGGLWIVLTPLGWWHRRRFQAARDEAAREAEGRRARDGDGDRPRGVDGRMIAEGSLVMLAVGLPALAVGVFELGIDDGDSAWRWLPLAVGGFATGIAVVSALLYAFGAGLSASAGPGPGSGRPAKVTIRSVRETGTFVNERPRMEFGFLVEPDGLPSYEVTKKATVPFTAMGSLRVGDGFRARVIGPDKPTAITIEWEHPVAGVGGGPDGGPGVDGTDVADIDVAARLDRLDALRTSDQISTAEYEAQRRRILDSL